MTAYNKVAFAFLDDALVRQQYSGVYVRVDDILEILRKEADLHGHDSTASKALRDLSHGLAERSATMRRTLHRENSSA